MTTYTFPFSALVGQDDLRLALEANAVNPVIGGVLIRGEKGTAKSTAVRSLARLLPQLEVVDGCPYSCDPRSPNPQCPAGPHREGCSVQTRPARLVELPVGASTDRVTGSLDIERVLTDGVKAFEPGLLAAAHRGVLYVDEVNLLSDHLVDILLDAAALGVNYVERDGVSVVHPARFLLVGTMNPEEGELRPQLLDRFGLSVSVHATRDTSARAEIVRRHLAYEADPQAFAKDHQHQDLATSERIAQARRRLDDVRLTDQDLNRIASVCAQLDVEGLRADIVCAKTAKALAALDQAAEVSREHIRQAAVLSLAHRRRQGGPDDPSLDESELDRALSDTDDTPPPDGTDPGAAAADAEQGSAQANNRDMGNRSRAAEATPGAPSDASHSKEQCDSGACQLDPPAQGYTAPVVALEGTGGGAYGKRSRAQGSGPGYPVSDTPYTGSELAIAPTVRAAARRKLGANDGRPGIELAPGDLRSVENERREGNLVVFVLDASASMAARRRMRAVKGAVCALLSDAYRRRDRVALIGFRGSGAEVVAEPTRSSQFVTKRLETLETGGRTPLAAGLDAACKLVHTQTMRETARRALAVVVTDGRANQGADPITDARRAMARLAAQGIGVVVVDTEEGLVRLGLARQLADTVQAPVISLDELESAQHPTFLSVRSQPRRAA